ncbi:patatin-like phospholipase family protein [Pelagibius litoralis]|uniref:Patatin-like phospholipase family protein n=1 Tax=Pelagibius litoralis TaxID=374515 RepID=A0A967EZ49_9PROT|nr:patatin-like phospholipase family protein [Pelagibius litoralis]NIA70025.1 patatin-like phospholipase family protein [Pelagibius litoralis]
MSASGGKGRRPINLALQGGGAHGAFTWGVLDRILEDDRLQIEAISGTSAGAMNAAVVADGIMRDGNEGARQCLRRFWKAVSDAGKKSPIQRTPIDIFMGNWSLDASPSYLFFDLLGRLASPYELNPLNLNPLQGLVEEMVDFERVRSCDRMKVFISATNVETGRVKVFDRRELTADMVMASACLPLLYQAVEIDGVPYWDGGYMGNPVLFPFFRGCSSDDVVIVQLNPITRKGSPKSAREILNRVNEITFNSSLLRDFRAIHFVSRLLEEGKLDESDYKKVLVHRIEAEEEIKPLGASSKVNAEWAFLEHLFEIGYRRADAWLDENFQHLGKRPTVDLKAMYQGENEHSRQ